MTTAPPLDSLGPARFAGVGAGVSQRPSFPSEGTALPPDPPRPEEIIAVMRCCGDGLHGDRAAG